MKQLVLMLLLAGVLLTADTTTVCACGSYATPYIAVCVPSVSGSWLVVWSDGRSYYNPWGCW